MLGRSLRFLVVLGAAVVIPYVWFNPDLFEHVKQKWNEWFAASGTSQANDFDFGSRFIAQGKPGKEAGPAARQPSPELTGQVLAFEEAFRFDVSPRWVLQRWSRVSTIHTERGLEGLRAALVTGTELDDIAGSITYYFDKQKQLRRIAFRGHTGDERQLVGLVTSQFNLQPEPALGAGFYVTRWNGKATSLLRVSHAPVVRAQRPHERLQVMLEINRPALGYGLSSAAQEMLNRDRVTSRL